MNMLRISFVAVLIAGALATALPSEQRAENVYRYRDIDIPHMRRQVISDNQSADTFDVLHHLSGNSPYFNSAGVGLTAAVPAGCNVTHAAYFIRHSDIYANDFEYEHSLAPFLEKLGNFSDRGAWARDGALAFLQNWTSPYTDPAEQIETVTENGKRDAQALGALVAERHAALLSGQGEGFKIWSGAATRDQDTAKAFAGGLGSAISGNLSLVIVDEEEGQSANTLTPHESCPAFSSSAGSTEQKAFLGVYTPSITARLNAVVPEFNWTAEDVFAAQSMCGYETVIRNSSDFCKVFGEEEWLGYEYASDLQYHRQLGYGSVVSPYLGMPWITASMRLLTGQANTTAQNSSAASQSVWISFSHREEPPFVVTALGLFNNTNATMPTTEINYERAWRTSNILPFLANIALERMACTAPNASAPAAYVRALVNAAAMPLPGCASGPDASCPVDEFAQFVSARQSLYGDFVTACGINSSETNATNTLGIYEGALPANGAAVQVESISTQGNASLNSTLTSGRTRNGAEKVLAAQNSAGVALFVGVLVGAVGCIV